jgi:hypothetical protein
VPRGIPPDPFPSGSDITLRGAPGGRNETAVAIGHQAKELEDVKVRAGIAVLAIAFAGPVLATSAQDADDRTDIYTVDLATGATTLFATASTESNGMTVAADGTIYLLTDDDELQAFSLPTDATPGAGNSLTADRTIRVTGLGNDEDLVAIDVRPADNTLYGITQESVVYTIDVESGQATAPGAATDPLIRSDDLGFDFNPTVDRIRVATSTGQNLRLVPDTGAVGTDADTGQPTVDGDITYAEGDPNAAQTRAIVGAAYTNNVADAEETQLYVIDAAQDVLALQDPPNDGVLNTVGPLGVDVSASAGFDITTDGVALLTVSADDDDFTARDDD